MRKSGWWREAVFYQIYPRSFADGNCDGIGDFAGMIERLDYLRGLGVDALWLSPHYPSPLFDCGYDVADYTGVAPEYGTLSDFQRFLDGAHQRGMRVILDLVLNHTSDQHPWFLESRASRDNPKRDWYVWHPGRDGGPPNNWQSTFGGPAWDIDPATGEYYYHYFFKEQPDLNWRNPAVKQAMFDAARFWLNRGVDGFRLDAIGTIFEDPALPDHTARLRPVEVRQLEREAVAAEQKDEIEQQWRALFGQQVDQPGVHQVMKELRAVIDEYDDRVLVGETDDLAYHGSGDDELHLVFNFPLMRTPRITPEWVRANQAQRLAALPPGAWPCNTLGNHDSPRVRSRYGDGENDEALARLAAALVLTLPGTPFLYNGEEIGMTDLLLDDLAQFRDMLGVWLYDIERETLGLPHSEALAHAAAFTRDKCRTPMHWANSPNAGFSPPGVDPWLPVHPNYAAGISVAAQETDPASMLNFYRRLINVRQTTPALRLGGHLAADSPSSACLAFVRTPPAAEPGAPPCLVVLNLGNDSVDAPLTLDAGQARCIFSTHGKDGQVNPPDHLRLAPFEIFLAELI
jgi:alpha-glucosidase